MSIPDDKFADRIEVIRGFVALQSAISSIALATGTTENQYVKPKLDAVIEYVNQMISRLEKESAND